MLYLKKKIPNNSLEHFPAIYLRFEVIPLQIISPIESFYIRYVCHLIIHTYR